MKRDYCFEVYPSGDAWRWRLRAPNGEIVAQGEGYTRKSQAHRAVERIKGNAGRAHVKELLPEPRDTRTDEASGDGVSGD